MYFSFFNAKFSSDSFSQNKQMMGDQMKEANFSLTKARHAAGDFSYAYF